MGPQDLARTHLKTSVENSLRRLKTDYIDLLQIHWPNPDVPIEETLGAMDTLVQEGKVCQLGVGNMNIEQLKEACQYSDHIVSVQQEYNLFERSIESEIHPFCMQHQVNIIAYSPLLQGRPRWDPRI